MDGRAPHGFRCHTTHFSATRWVIYAKVTTSRETDFGATDDNQVLESKLDRKSRKSLLGIEEDSLIEETWDDVFATACWQLFRNENADICLRRLQCVSSLPVVLKPKSISIQSHNFQLLLNATDCCRTLALKSKQSSARAIGAESPMKARDSGNSRQRRIMKPAVLNPKQRKRQKPVGLNLDSSSSDDDKDND